MGYRTTARLPKIEAVPSNKGLYLDLYTEAAKQIGCKLDVIREPKKRILRGLRQGTIDFYPGLTFREERSIYAFYFSNGLPDLYVGLTRTEVPEISHYRQLKGKTILLALGGPSEDADKYGITIKTPPELTFEKAFEYILDKHADFYKDEIGTLAYYLKKHPRKNELKLHTQCCGKVEALTVGFSRNSPHYTEEANPNYQKAQQLNYDNFPIRLKERSTAYRLSQALNDLKNSGYTDRLYQRYYGINPNEITQ